jgi:ribose transport system permease protein
MENSTVKAQKKIDWVTLLKENITIIVMLILFIVSSLISEHFLTRQNIFNLLRQLTPPTLIAMGMLFVILTGGIDLSVGSVVAMASVFTAHLLRTQNLAVTLLLVLLAAAAFGAFNGFLVAKRRLAPFVVTLAGMTIARGIAFIVSRGMPERIRNTFLLDFATDSFLGIPYIVWFAMAVVVILVLVQKFTVFGRFVQAVGSNETAVKLSGINSNIYKIGVYVLSAVLAAISGVIIASRVGMGSPLAGYAFELNAIAAVVIGGAALSGGRGRVINTLMGVWVLGMIGNIMNLLNVPSYPQQVFQGLIIIVAVLLQSDRKGKDIQSSSNR